MVKFARKKLKAAVSAGNRKKAGNSRTKTAEYVGNLLELHKLQGAILTRLDKEVR